MLRELALILDDIWEAAGSLKMAAGQIGEQSGDTSGVLHNLCISPGASAVQPAGRRLRGRAC